MPRPISIKAYFTWPFFKKKEKKKDFCDTKKIPIPWNTNAPICILCIFSYFYIWSFFIPNWCFDVLFVTVCYLYYVVRYCYKSLWISVSFACLCCILLFMCFIICINKSPILTEIFVYSRIAANTCHNWFMTLIYGFQFWYQHMVQCESQVFDIPEIEPILFSAMATHARVVPQLICILIWRQMLRGLSAVWTDLSTGLRPCQSNWNCVYLTQSLQTKHRFLYLEELGVLHVEFLNSINLSDSINFFF